MRPSQFLRPEREWIVIAAISPFLMFPTVYPIVSAAALAAVLVLWAFQYQAGMVAELRTPLKWPVAVVGAMALVGFWVSPSPVLAWPRLMGVVLGILVLKCVVACARSQRNLRLAMALYLLAGAAIVCGGLLAGPQWQRKSNALFGLASRIPHLFEKLPGAGEAVNPNALGGTTLFFTPLLFALFVPFLWPRRRALHAWLERQRPFSLAPIMSSLVVKPAYLTLLTGFLIVLVLSESRTCWISTLVALVAMLSIRRGRAVAVAALILILAWVVMKGNAGGRLMLERVQAEISAAGRFNLHDRPELWRQALSQIKAHPFVGLGFAGFRHVVVVSEPPPGAAASYVVPHAHNVFLQTALDIGVPGLVGYVGLLLTATILCFRVYVTARNGEAWVALGLWANLLAVHIFGLVDAVSLGAKVGVFFWWNLGLIAALFNCSSQQDGTLPLQ